MTQTEEVFFFFSRDEQWKGGPRGQHPFLSAQALVEELLFVKAPFLYYILDEEGREPYAVAPQSLAVEEMSWLSSDRPVITKGQVCKGRRT